MKVWGQHHDCNTMTSVTTRIAILATMLAIGTLLVVLNLPSGAGNGDTGNRTDFAQRLQWADLLPDDLPPFEPPETVFDLPDARPGVSGNLQQSKPLQKADRPRADLDGKRVSIAGYMTPFNVSQGETRAFLLVPYVGACIHVPAPPPNQIVLVESADPVPVRSMYDPFTAIGTLHVDMVDTGLAAVGYTMTLERIAPYTSAAGKLEGIRSANDGD